MSAKHPVIAVTGSSGAGTTTVKRAFEHIFHREKITPLIIEGDSYHRYDRAAMKEQMAKEEEQGNKFFSHFGENANHFDKLAETLAPIQDKMREFDKNPQKVWDIIEEGNRKARKTAQETMEEVRKAIGL